jgi:hypothetical protein
MLARALALLASASLVHGAGAAEMTARQIIEFATERNGGQPWLHAKTNVMRGDATLCRDGRPERCTEADHYVMYRVYPRDLAAAHAGSGKFRLDAHVGDRVLFKTSFDGERHYDQNGPVAAERAATGEGTAFGFSAIRFALEEGFSIERLTDDQVEGHPAYFVRVTDPSGTTTLFGVDKQDGSVRYAGWTIGKSWHNRLYSDFYWVDDPGFRQPGRVRHYFDGVKTVDIRWTSAELNTAIPDEVFVLP